MPGRRPRAAAPRWWWSITPRSDGTIAEVARRGVALDRQSRLTAASPPPSIKGFAALNCPYVLLLNPDAVLPSRPRAAARSMRLPGAAGAGGRLLDAAGTSADRLHGPALPHARRSDFGSSLAESGLAQQSGEPALSRLGLEYRHAAPVEQPAGAFLMVRRAVWEELGGFDEGFFPLWFEDVDFCRRALRPGLSLVLCRRRPLQNIREGTRSRS